MKGDSLQKLQNVKVDYKVDRNQDCDMDMIQIIFVTCGVTRMPLAREALLCKQTIDNFCIALCHLQMTKHTLCAAVGQGTQRSFPTV